MGPRRAIWLGAAIALGALAWGIERLVVTDTEAIEALVERAEEAVRDGDFETLAGLLHPDYEAEGRDRDEAVRYVRRLWRRYRPVGLDVELGTVRVEGDRAEAPAVADVRALGRPFTIRLRTGFGRTPDGWRLREARPTGWGR